MAVSEINQFYIFAHLSIKEMLLKELQKLGCLEIKELDNKTELCNWEDFKKSRNINPSSELNKIKYCIDLLSGYQDKEENALKSIFSTKETIDYNKLVEIYEKTNYEKIYQQCKEIESKINAFKLQENKLRAIAQELSDWKELEIELYSINKSKYLRYLLGSIAKNNLEIFTNELKQFNRFNIIQTIKEDKNTSKLVVICLKADYEKVQQITQKYHFERYNYYHSFKGTPVEILEDVSKELKQISNEKDILEKKLKEISKNNPNIYKIYDFLSIKKEKDEITDNLKKSKDFFVINGWIKKRDIPKLQNRLNENFKEYEVYLSEPKEDDNVPVALENHKFVKPFEVITELYSLPSYFEMDPTPILAIFYFIFFGFCLSDVGYGAILALLCYLAMKKLNLGEGPNKFFKLLYYCGISSIIGGILVGSWFGDILNYLPAGLSNIRYFFIDKLSLFDPINNPIPLLILSIALGVIQVYTGIILKFLHNVKNGKIFDGLMDQISWLFFLTGIILILIKGMLPSLFTTIAWFLLIAGMLTLVATQGRNNKNIIMRIGSGILSLYDITGYFSDILSYSRLFALSLATGIIATMFNMLATMANIPIVGIFITIIILFIGHVFNLLISGLGAFIHDARLQYVEFFTKFYQAGGVPFRPFSLKTKYTNIEEIHKK